jgi:hypothetical protein
MKVVINFMFNKLINETTINDGIRFVYFSMTYFATRLFFCTTTSLYQNSIHYYFFSIFKFVVRVVWILVATLLGMS